MGEGARARPCPHGGELSLKVEHASTLFPRENAKGDNIADEIANSLAAAVETETTHSHASLPLRCAESGMTSSETDSGEVPTA